MNAIEITPEEKFWTKVHKTKTCWLWIAAKSKGYGFVWFNQKRQLAHRISYQLYKGTIPKGLHLDHICRNPSCVNPDHLEAVSPRENIIRGIGPSAIHARKTHCKRGHPFIKGNYRINGKGARVCILCPKNKNKRINIYIGPTRSKNHCIHGHEYTAANTLINKLGYRCCRVCKNKTANLPAHKDRAQCIHGHRYTEQTVYLNSRDIKECRVCRRLRFEKRNEKILKIKHLI